MIVRSSPRRCACLRLTHLLQAANNNNTHNTNSKSNRIDSAKEEKGSIQHKGGAAATRRPYTPFQISQLFEAKAVSPRSKRTVAKSTSAARPRAQVPRSADQSQTHTVHSSTTLVSSSPIASVEKPTNTDASHSTSNSHNNTISRSTVAADTRGDVPPTMVSSSSSLKTSFLEKLHRTLNEKRVHWNDITRAFPEIAVLPIFKEREFWSRHYLQSGSALPILPTANSGDENKKGERRAAHHSGGPPPRLLLCSADTGTGKSVLVPLFALDVHWQTLQQRISATVAALKQEDSRREMEKVGNSSRDHHHDDSNLTELTPFAMESKTAFAKSFQECSRICVLVSQPTRMACAEMAKYTSKLLAERSTTSPDDSHTRNEVGKRVGYAVGGEVRYGKETEIIFATPGYILNALQADNGMLQPTAIMVDEAHSRELETDLLLAWLRLHITGPPEGEKAAPPSSSTAALLRLRLRHVVIMSATMRADSMFRYFHVANNKGSRPIWMAFAHQRDALQKTLATSTLSASSSSPSSRENYESDAVTDALALLDHEASSRYVTRSSPEVVTGTSHRIERYFLSDLRGAFLESKILFEPWLQELNRASQKSPPSFGSSSTQGKGKRTLLPRNARTPLLLTPDGQKLINSLTHFFSARNAMQPAAIAAQQGSFIAQLILYLLQALRLRMMTTASNSVSEGGEPATVLVFLPGFAEIQVVMQALENLCSVDSTASRSSVVPPSTRDASARTGEVSILRYGEHTFSVPVLHVAAVGNPQEQLALSVSCGAPLRVILSTSVAESSVTIPQVKVVLDLCMERKFIADPITGTLCKHTVMIDYSSLRQRGGRTGRTCDGVVIHLMPQSAVPVPITGAKQHTSGHGMMMPALASESPSTALLRAKALFSDCTAALLVNMPRPYSPLAMEAAYRILVDSELFVPAPHGSSKYSPFQPLLPGDGSDYYYSLELQHRINKSCLSAKGRVVSSLPIPPEQALFVYHAMQFAVVEDAILIACAMTVPSLFLRPRVSQHSVFTQRPGSSRELPASLSPLEQYYKTVWAQRKLAGAALPEDNNNNNNSNSEYLSEPLVMRALLLKWYLCSTNEAMYHFLATYGVNRNALRSVDFSVAQCSQRIIQMLFAEEDELRRQNHVGPTNGKHSNNNYNAASFPSEGYSEEDAPVAPLLDRRWPPGYRRHLVKSLQRLRQAALSRVTHRINSGEVLSPTQWYSADSQLAQLFTRHYLPTEALASESTAGEALWHPTFAAELSDLKQKAEEKVDHHLRSRTRSLNLSSAQRLEVKRRGTSMAWQQALTSSFTYELGPLEDRLCAAYIAAFARNTMSGEDGGHRRHHNRLTRNWSVLEDDSQHTCTFAVDVSAATSQMEISTTTASTVAAQKAALWSRLTPQALWVALSPYLRGCGLKQIELFASGRTAVARFMAQGYEGLLASVQQNMIISAPQATPHNSAPSSDDASGAAGSRQDIRLEPVVLPQPRAVPVGGAADVQLAPLGVSVLMAAQHALQRITVELSAPTSTESSHHQPHLSHSSVAIAPLSTGGLSRQASTSQSPTSEQPLRMGEKKVSAPLTSRTIVKSDLVRWRDQMNVEHTLCRADVDAVGLGHLFPNPPPTTASERDEDGEQKVTDKNKNSVEKARVTRDNVGNDYMQTAAASVTHAVVSVRAPINVTRGVYWRMNVPSLARLVHPQLHHHPSSHVVAAPSEGTQSAHASEKTTSTPNSLYCAVCQVLNVSEAQFADHCRSPIHLRHLRFAAEHGMDAEKWLAMGAGSDTPLAQLAWRGGASPISPTSQQRGGVFMPIETEVRTCRVSNLSYLNALQDTSADGMGRPLAVAGALMSTQTALRRPAADDAIARLMTDPTNINANLLAHYKHQGSQALTALHVWVLSLGGKTAPASSPLLVLAGYLAASTHQFPTALLFNEDHAYVHGVMLYGSSGVWRLPRPLRASQLGLLQRVLDGGGWPGILQTAEEDASESTQDGARMYEGLHWCVATAACPQCTRSTVGTLPRAGGEASVSEVVEATLLLTLQEYMQARRKIVHMSEYVQRVVLKLNLLDDDCTVSLPSPRQPLDTNTKHTAIHHGRGARHLADYLRKWRPSQSLQDILIDVGCHFLAPPPTVPLLGMEQVNGENGTEAAASSSEMSCSNSRISTLLHGAGGSSGDGTSLTVRFTTPPVLPTYLPSRVFGDTLRTFNQRRHGMRVAATSGKDSGPTPSLVDASAASQGRDMSEQF